MSIINVLDKNIAELIAAGEVVERPSSVIKELVENSIDAGARTITVEIQNGGIRFIRVTDDGCGISHEEIPVAFLRHATSKISTKDDLDSISTMGFRGEALASISAVARVELLSKQEGKEFGSSFKIDGGVRISHSEIGSPDGTTIIIRELFYNTPARLKFLKKDISEGNSVASIIDKLALSHPEIAFRFIRDNKPVRITPGDGKLYSAIYSVFGKQFAASLIEVDYQVAGVQVSGFVSSPLFPKGNRTMQYFFVNTRYVKSSSFVAALEEGYRNSIMTGKFPACVINIEINPNEVDVNVHPAKTEVRFANDRIVFDAIYFAVKNAILNADNEKIINAPKQEYVPEKAQEPAVETSQGNFESYSNDGLRSRISTFNIATNTEKQSLDLDNKQKTLFKAVDITPKKSRYEQRTDLILNEENPGFDGFKYINNESTIKKQAFTSFDILKNEQENVKAVPIIIGELWKTYILCEVGDEMVLIDKHAAHERIRFEKLRKDFVSSSQLLAESIYVEMDTEVYTVIIQNKDILMDAGIEVLGSNNYQIEVTAIPAMLHGEDISVILNELAEIFLKGNNETKSIFDEILHSVACKSAIKANDNNDINDLKKLAATVLNDDSIRFCPHGRPIITKFLKKEIEKNFKRII